MPIRLVHVVIDSADPGSLARFWAAALGWEVAAEVPAEVVVWPAGFSCPGRTALPLVFVPVPEAKTGKNRVHLDLATRVGRTSGGRGGAAARLGRGPRGHRPGRGAL